MTGRVEETEIVTVLAVDDQPQNLRLLDAVLTPRGHRVVPASSGEEALRLLQDGGIDIVLLDIVMPGIDGHETLRRLRDGVLDSRVPVVAVTALAMTEDKERASRAGFDGYLEKPVSPRSLPGQVAGFLENGGGA